MFNELKVNNLNGLSPNFKYFKKKLNFNFNISTVLSRNEVPRKNLNTKSFRMNRFV